MKLLDNIKAGLDDVTTGLSAKPARGSEARQQVGGELWLTINSPS